LGFHNVSKDRTAQGLFNLVCSVLHEVNMESKLVDQCYDGACGLLTDLQARVKELAPNALFTHCLAHRLNLVFQHIFVYFLLIYLVSLLIFTNPPRVLML
jgi:hypothetical protein